MMAKVFRSPREYLPGPDSIPELRRDMQHFVIVGGGAAGLVSAYTLLRLGHKVGKYQIQKRLFGRNKLIKYEYVSYHR